MSNQDSDPPDDADVVVLRGPTQDGEGVEVLRARNGNVEAGEMRAVRPGASIKGVEIVRLLAREGSPMVWNVKVEYDGREKGTEGCARDGHGPAKVSSRAYRDGWDAIFGKDEAPEEPVLN
jgi:hypothetical protein